MVSRGGVTSVGNAMNDPGARLDSGAGHPTRSNAFAETAMNRLTLMMLTAALATGAQLAHADDGSAAPTKMLIHYSDLDLSRPAGAMSLYRRLHTAAETVCTPLNGQDVGHQLMFRRCVGDAIARAVTEVDQPALGAYYRAKLQGRNAVSPETTARK
jgi:UrcA family protein